MNDLGAGANVTTKKYNNLTEADPDEFAPKTHAELEQRIALLEKVAECAVECTDFLKGYWNCIDALNDALRAAGYLEGGK